MSTVSNEYLPEESPGYLWPNYWGERKLVLRSKEDIGKIQPIDNRLAKFTYDSYNSDPPVGEQCVPGYNFFPELFSPGTIFKLQIEKVSHVGKYPLDGTYKPYEGQAIFLPTSYGGGLFVPVKEARGNVHFDKLPIQNNQLVVGWTTESFDKSGRGTMERLNSLEIFEESADIYSNEKERLLKTIGGKWLNLLQN